MMMMMMVMMLNITSFLMVLICFLETADGFNITWHRGYIVVVLYMGIKTQNQDVGEERSGPKDFITSITGWTADLIRPRPS